MGGIAIGLVAVFMLFAVLISDALQTLSLKGEGMYSGVASRPLSEGTEPGLPGRP